MDDLQGRRQRRFLARRPAEVPTERENVGALLPEVPRIEALDALLREVDGLRLSLELDLTMAASAVDAGSLEIARDIIDGDRAFLQGFEDRALGHVSELAGRRKRRLRVPAAPFVAAAAVVGFLVGVVPHTTSHSDSITNAANANASFNRLTAAAADGESAEVITAANALHLQLQSVVANAKRDPGAATAALALLQQERTLIVASGGSSAALATVVAESNKLTHLIEAALTPLPVGTLRPTHRPTLAPVPAVTSSPTPAPHPTTSKPTQKPAPAPTSSATTHSTASPSPTSNGPGLPTNPGLS